MFYYNLARLGLSRRAAVVVWEGVQGPGWAWLGFRLFCPGLGDAAVGGLAPGLPGPMLYICNIDM